MTSAGSCRGTSGCRTGPTSSLAKPYQAVNKIVLGVNLDKAGAAEIAGRCRGTPRIANRLLRRVRDWAQVHGNGVVDLPTAHAALDLYEVDALGLDRIDRAVLELLVTRFGGGPVGLSNLAVAIGEEPETIETVAEPFLVRLGMIVRTPRGRVATAAAWQHLGITPTTPLQSTFDLEG